MSARRPFTIGQLAAAAAIPASTVRYYERIGLLVPEDRSGGNYRLYGQESLRRLRFIRAAQASGFTLQDVRLLLGAPAGRPPSCQDVQGLMSARLAEIDVQLGHLRQLKRTLRAAIVQCEKADRPQCCHLIESLEITSGPR